MAEFLRTSGISSKIEDIIVKAKKQIYLVTPYLQLSNNLFERLNGANKRGITITLVYGKSDLTQPQAEQLSSLKLLKLYYYDNLHAKCYFNEQEMVITSMNLYEFSEKNNREMGVFLSREADKEMYGDACRETLDIIEHASLHQIKKTTAKTRSPKGKKTSTAKLPSEGHCIRCFNTIPLDLSRPLCYDCFGIWRQYEDGEYPEEFCQVCGDDENVCFDRPVCYSCYKKHKKELAAVL